MSKPKFEVDTFVALTKNYCCYNRETDVLERRPAGSCGIVKWYGGGEWVRVEMIGIPGELAISVDHLIQASPIQALAGQAD